jgi:ArsR family transcriptional regulator
MMDETALAKAPAHPARIRIVRLRQATPGCIGREIVGAVGLARSTVSEHLGFRKSAGTICGEIDGARIRYALNPVALAPLTTYVARLTQPSAGACGIPGKAVLA